MPPMPPVTNPDQYWTVEGIGLDVPPEMGVLVNDTSNCPGEIVLETRNAKTHSNDPVSRLEVENDGSFKFQDVATLDWSEKYGPHFSFEYRFKDGSGLFSNWSLVIVAVYDLFPVAVDGDTPYFCAVCSCPCEKTEDKANENAGQTSKTIDGQANHTSDTNFDSKVSVDRPVAATGSGNTLESYVWANKQLIGNFEFPLDDLSPSGTYQLSMTPNLMAFGGGVVEIDVVDVVRDSQGVQQAVQRSRTAKIVHPRQDDPNVPVPYTHPFGDQWSLIDYERLIVQPAEPEVRDFNYYTWLRGDGNAISKREDPSNPNQWWTVGHNDVGAVFLGSNQIRDKYGTVRTFDGNGRLITKVDRNGNTTSYDYDQTNIWQLTSVTDPFNRVTEYNYNGAGLLHEIVTSTAA